MIIFVIAILGLLGIVTYTVEKRYKEIGIRKVIGASILSIIKELSYSFLKLIVLATVICVPLGYLIAYLFIDFFAFNDGINISLMSGMYAVIFSIALLAIIIMAAKAAMANPIKSLRTE
ncbi:ABC transporter permease [Gelidibacter japonicus]|uniref:ABC transporter permease n=1 Tax=Gelidibacter japonicus TaxID=1962232 RepID=UPI003A95C73E